jgi:hypothetical protein
VECALIPRARAKALSHSAPKSTFRRIDSPQGNIYCPPPPTAAARFLSMKREPRWRKFAFLIWHKPPPPLVYTGRDEPTGGGAGRGGGGGDGNLSGPAYWQGRSTSAAQFRRVTLARLSRYRLNRGYRFPGLAPNRHLSRIATLYYGWQFWRLCLGVRGS